MLTYVVNVSWVVNSISIKDIVGMLMAEWKCSQNSRQIFCVSTIHFSKLIFFAMKLYYL